MIRLPLSKKNVNVNLILNSGQVFRYEYMEDNHYILYSPHGVVKVEQNHDLKIYGDHVDESYWHKYFDLDRDYDKLNHQIRKIDPSLKSVMNMFEGLRILQQDPFEMLITFIISQSKSILQIRKLVNDLSKTYGEKVVFEGESYYLFPKPEVLKKVREEEFRDMKFGYRAPYLVDAIQKVVDQEVDLQRGYFLSDQDLRQMLESIKGVGHKVASCVMLFAYGRHDIFPVDTWMRKAMLGRYDHIPPKWNNKKLELIGEEMFGHSSGLAQQYLFEAERRKKGQKV